MSAAVRNAAGATKAVANIWVRTESGLAAAGQAFIRDASRALRQFFGQFGITINGPGAFSRVNSSTSASVTTRAVSVSVSGSVGTVTYAWSVVSGGDGITINSPSASSTTFSGVVGPGESLTGTYVCTVDDEGGHHAVSSEAQVGISNLYFGDPSGVPL